MHQASFALLQHLVLLQAHNTPLPLRNHSLFVEFTKIPLRHGIEGAEKATRFKTV